MVEKAKKNRKWLKRLGILVGFILAFMLVMQLTNNNQIYKTVRYTVLKGRLSPTIDDYKIFAYRKVKAGKPDPWMIDSAYNSTELTEAEEKYHTDHGSAAFLIIRDHKILYEEYWDGYSDSSLTNGWSMTKSIVGHLIGCAIDDGLIPSVDEYVSTYLPLYMHSGITIRHLLTMRAGIGFGESYMNPFEYPARSLYTNNIRKVHKDYPAQGKPGLNFQYESGNTQLLAFIVNKVTGKTLSEYASEKLWKPVGAHRDALWSLDRKGGMEKAFCCFNTNARDFARLAQLYLNHGIWNGDTLIDPAYVARATRSNGDLWPENHCSNCENYGYQWWILQDEKHNIFYMRGFQGQYVCAMPDRGVIMVRLGHSQESDRKNGHPTDLYVYLDMADRILKESK